jgi:hypothetical protein
MDFLRAGKYGSTLKLRKGRLVPCRALEAIESRPERNSRSPNEHEAAPPSSMIAETGGLESVALSSECVACGVEVVLALLRAKEIADLTDGAPEGVDDPDDAGSQNGLQLCESHLDRIEVGL